MWRKHFASVGLNCVAVRHRHTILTNEARSTELSAVNSYPISTSGIIVFMKFSTSAIIAQFFLRYFWTKQPISLILADN